MSEFVMVGLLYTGHPTNPPQLVVPLVVAKEPSNTQPLMVMLLLAPLSVATNPPWVPSPLLLLLMLTELRQLVMVSAPCDSPTKPEAFMALV